MGLEGCRQQPVCHPTAGVSGIRGHAAGQTLACPTVLTPGAPLADQFFLGGRRWGSHRWAVLGLTMKPAGYGAWCNRAHRWLSGGHPEVEQLLELVRIEVHGLKPGRGGELARRAGAHLYLDEFNATVTDGIVYAGAGGIAPRSRLLGSRRGL